MIPGDLFLSKCYRLVNDNDVRCLQTFGALLDSEFNSLTFFKIAKTFTLNCRIMHEDIIPAFTGKETVTLATVEPFDRPDGTFRHFDTPFVKKK